MLELRPQQSITSNIVCFEKIYLQVGALHVARVAFRPPLRKIFVVIRFWTPTLQIKHIAASLNVDAIHTNVLSQNVSKMISSRVK